MFFILDKNCKRYLARRWGTSTARHYKIHYNSTYNALLHVTQIFFSNFKYIRKNLENCVRLSCLFPFQKRFAKTVEFRPSKAGPGLKRANYYLAICICYINHVKLYITAIFLFTQSLLGHNNKSSKSSSLADVRQWKTRMDWQAATSLKTGLWISFCFSETVQNQIE